MAHDPALFFFRGQAGANGSVQPAPEDGLHVGDSPRAVIHPYRNRPLQSCAIFPPRFADWRIPLGPGLAFLRSVRIALVRLGAPDHGCPPWMEQFHVHADGLEAQLGILALTIVHSCQKRCEIGTRPKLQGRVSLDPTPATNTKPL